ncbi:MAG TPA: hypothetical protein VIJ73_12730, partial [Methylomirabilota bacterium]
GEVYLLAGRHDDARRSAHVALASAIEHRERGYEGWALRLLAEIALRSDPADVTRATDYARRALAVAEELGMRPLAAHAHLALGRSLAAAADPADAKHHLAAAVELLVQMNMRAWIGPARDALERLA